MVGEREREGGREGKKKRRNGEVERGEGAGWMTSSLLSSRWRGVDKVSPRGAIGGQDQAGYLLLLTFGRGGELISASDTLFPLVVLSTCLSSPSLRFLFPSGSRLSLSPISSRSAEALPAFSETINSPSSPDYDTAHRGGVVTESFTLPKIPPPPLLLVA